MRGEERNPEKVPGGQHYKMRRRRRRHPRIAAYVLVRTGGSVQDGLTAMNGADFDTAGDNMTVPRVLLCLDQGFQTSPSRGQFLMNF